MRVLPLLVLLCAAVLSVEGSGKPCKKFGQICSKDKNCIPSTKGSLLTCSRRRYLGKAAMLCRFGGRWCPDGKSCRHGLCVWPKGHPAKRCYRFGDDCGKGRKCSPCFLGGGFCCRRAALIGNNKYCGVSYKVYGKACGHKYRGKYCLKIGSFCPDGKVCRKQKYGKKTCVFKKKQPGCYEFGQICGLKYERNCVQCYLKKGLCCRRRSKLGKAAKHCRYGGSWCPYRKICKGRIIKGVMQRRCVRRAPPTCKHLGGECGKNRVCLRCNKNKLCCRRAVTKKRCERSCKKGSHFCSLYGCPAKYSGWCCLKRTCKKGIKC